MAKYDLNDSQSRFVDEYLVDLNATQAAIRAGYSEKSAASQAHELLKNPKVEAAIQAKRARLSKKLEISTERVLNELARVAFSDMRNVAEWNAGGVDFKDSSTLSDDVAAAVSEVSSDTTRSKDGVTVKHKIKLHDKMRALEMLSRHLNLFAPDSAQGGKGETIPITPQNIAELCKAARDG